MANYAYSLANTSKGHNIALTIVCTFVNTTFASRMKRAAETSIDRKKIIIPTYITYQRK